MGRVAGKFVILNRDHYEDRTDVGFRNGVMYDRSQRGTEAKKRLMAIPGIEVANSLTEEEKQENKKFKEASGKVRVPRSVPYPLPPHPETLDLIHKRDVKRFEKWLEDARFEDRVEQVVNKKLASEKPQKDNFVTKTSVTVLLTIAVALSVLSLVLPLVM